MLGATRSALTVGTVRRIGGAARRTTLAPKRFASGGGGYNEPSGYLFGEKPPPPGQKRVKEDWEDLWMWGMFGGMAFGAVIIYYKPDTSIQSWAMKEARQRLQESDLTWQYKPTPNSGHPEGIE